jgi:integrase
VANLYKKPITAKDPKTGKKTKARSKKWWGRYKDALGVDRRVPLARDKAAAQAMLNELVLKAEREAAGQTDPFEEHGKRPLMEHVDDFEQHLRHKGNTEQHVGELATKVRKIVGGCKWSFIRDVSASRVQKFLADLRSSGLSVQTSNHYLRAIKQFSRWLVRDRRTNDDPLAHLARLNVKVDRRHDRRALTRDEFAKLVESAISGPPIVCIPGPDRAMMYILSAWTGYRKKEIGSLTKRSLRLDDAPPTATVAAAYSKRRRQDTQVLHPEVVSRLRASLETKTDLGPDDLLFPVSGKVPGGTERRTSKMMKLDLERVGIPYQDEDGLFADFHSNRHTFITSLEHAGVRPRTAQSLARHSDIRLTMGVYTHVGLHDQITAIESLPAPPDASSPKEPEAAELRATGTDHAQPAEKMVPTVVPRGASIGAIRLASQAYGSAPDCTEESGRGASDRGREDVAKPAENADSCANSHESASPRIALLDGKSEARPGGFEPPTLGSEERVSVLAEKPKNPFAGSGLAPF